MKDLLDIVKEKPSLVAKLLHKDVKVTLKVDGVSLQVLWNDEKKDFEYRKGSKDETKLGEKIDDLSLMFEQSYINAIDHITQYKSVIDDYKFLTFEIFNNTLYLISAVSKKDKFIKKISTLKEIAKSIDAQVVPILFAGELSDEQKGNIVSYVKDPSGVDNFKSFVYSLFNQYKDFPHAEWNAIPEVIEGIVFDFVTKDDKIAQYKLIDPVFRYNKDKYIGEITKAEVDHKLQYDEFANMLIGWMSENCKKYDDDKLKSLNENFKKLAKDYKLLNEFVNYSAKLPQVNVDIAEKYFDKDIRKLIKNMGQNMLTFYVNFILLFYKGKYVSKDNDFQYKQILENI